MGCSGNDERHDKLIQLIITLDGFCGIQQKLESQYFLSMFFCGMFQLYCWINKQSTETGRRKMFSLVDSNTTRFLEGFSGR